MPGGRLPEVIALPTPTPKPPTCRPATPLLLANAVEDGIFKARFGRLPLMPASREGSTEVALCTEVNANGGAVFGPLPQETTVPSAFMAVKVFVKLKIWV